MARPSFAQIAAALFPKKRTDPMASPYGYSIDVLTGEIAALRNVLKTIEAIERRYTEDTSMLTRAAASRSKAEARIEGLQTSIRLLDEAARIEAGAE